MKKDFLFIVPQRSYLLHKHIIRTVLWAVESDKTYDVISGNAFTEQYGDLPEDVLYETIKKQYTQVGDFGNLSKKEKESFNKFMKICKKNFENKVTE